MKRRIKWIVLVLIIIAAGYFLYNKMYKPEAQLEPVEPPQAITFEVTQETITNSIQVKGNSNYEKETLVYAPYASKVTKWKVENGGQVKKGDLLFTLDQEALKNEIATQEATIRKAKLEAELNEFVSQQDEENAALGATEAERIKALTAQEATRLGDELNQVNAEIQARELTEKKTKLKTALYYAPASGIFLFDSASEIPQTVTDNQYIGKIVDMNKLEFIALVGEQDVFRIKTGMKVDVKMTAIKDLKLSGEVTKVAKFAKTASGQNATTSSVPQFEVVITLQPDEHLIGGLSLNGEIETVRKENATVVSSIAVMHEGDLSYVMLDKGDGQYERKDIEVGLETTDKTEVLSGLKVGDVVVLQ
ncbi:MULTISPECIES: efflux RND transporter periplasmic adaptor subunit [Paenibacillus]|uniref:Efflux transporter periplasmic adaptor subunit n=1 Tax=Paenibacillus odorifer TaxID=189426 RepID=A0A1R0WTY3_9BACL|nr:MULTISPECIES: efflux RND transporter periplasmic adaptor subunit [Paenibacillus]ETT66073.1 RND family efflux transporter MFP subunit [Paenibacillus sp. FSL H8-237]MEC0133578.1 efflux RND transporter periplasmic adaptor subunit [Paenibacillus odorifer]MEC0224897.1 efflux RND transporter periplasmic adaptor subunit [Paenibacillus odorifer]OMD03931.1 efflux transporter periplasmic adaptor subunit [Paenibacillus odorifer]OMD21397.1 efflux transporter periplasmic adaptor subunit [Paenibacillus o